jgi:glutaredoxin 3
LGVFKINIGQTADRNFKVGNNTSEKLRGGIIMEEVTVYTTPACPWCSKTKTYLKDKGVTFAEKNVADDFQAAQEMIDLTGQRSVPVIKKGGQYVVGFDPEKLESIIH